MSTFEVELYNLLGIRLGIDGSLSEIKQFIDIRNVFTVAKSVSNEELTKACIELDNTDFNFIEQSGEVMFIPVYDPTSGFCLAGVNSRKSATVFKVGHTKFNPHYLALLENKNWFSDSSSEDYYKTYFRLPGVFISFFYQLLLTKVILDQELEVGSIYKLGNRYQPDIEEIVFHKLSSIEEI